MKEAILNRNQYWSYKLSINFLHISSKTLLKAECILKVEKSSYLVSLYPVLHQRGLYWLRVGTSHTKEQPFFPFYSFIQHLCVSAYHVPNLMLWAILGEYQLVFSIGTWHIMPLFPSRANVMHIYANKWNVPLWSFGGKTSPPANVRRSQKLERDGDIF